MKKNSKIFIAGARGLVGSALVRHLTEKGCSNLLVPERKDLDLLDAAAVGHWFETHRPEYVFQAAGRVGGIHANNTYPAEFIYQNLTIQNNIVHHAYLNKVKKLLFLGSSCIYPKHCAQPMQETDLMTGPLEPTNAPYAMAKIAGIEMCWAYNRQYGTCFIPVMPTNLYGPNDNFDPETSHVLPALIRKFYEGRQTNAARVVIWGTGAPKREFLHVDDLADACCFLMARQFDDPVYLDKPLYNIGAGKDISIRELAKLIKQISCYEGDIVFDSSKPDGTPRKLLDTSRINRLGWHSSISLDRGILDTFNWYKEQCALKMIR